MGYRQVTMKGKTIMVAPVPGVATAKLQSLLNNVMLAAAASPEEEDLAETAAGTKALGCVRRLVEVRRELLPALALGNKGCADRFRCAACAHCRCSEHDVCNVHLALQSCSPEGNHCRHLQLVCQPTGAALHPTGVGMQCLNVLFMQFISCKDKQGMCF